MPIPETPSPDIGTISKEKIALLCALWGSGRENPEFDSIIQDMLNKGLFKPAESGEEGDLVPTPKAIEVADGLLDIIVSRLRPN